MSIGALNRSHKIITIYLDGKEKSSTMVFVITAGSERVSKVGVHQDRLREGAMIGLSLGSLGKVMVALS